MTKKKNNFYHIYNKHDKFLTELPKIIQKSEYFKILHHPKEFREVLLNAISKAHNYIYLVALYLEHDLGGKEIIDTILFAKKNNPTLKIKIIVDLYRAQRSRIGEFTKHTNIDWYYNIIYKYSNIDFFSIYGVPININEALGVFHLKGFIIDDTVLYSGASLNNEYLNIHDKYRHDRYHVIQNQQLSKVMCQYIDNVLLKSKVINKFEKKNFSKKIIKNKNHILLFRKVLRKVCYNYIGNANFNELSITPLVGLGKKSILNQTIYHLISSVKHKIILCTPYFNIPNSLVQNLICLLNTGRNIEIIVGDKTANDFYNPNYETKPFKLISALPYLYEVNLRCFSKKLQNYINNKQLIIRIWKNDTNGYHIKGLWIDNEWQLLTSSNLNPRALRFDLENALLIHDPLHELIHKNDQELKNIRNSTKSITHYSVIQQISDYPVKIKQLIQRIRKIKFDRLINHLL